MPEKEFKIIINNAEAKRNIEDTEKAAAKMKKALDQMSNKAEAETEKAAESINEIDKALESTEKNIKVTTFAAYRSIDTLIGTFRGLLNIFGDALDPVERAMISGILAAVEGLMAIAAAQYSNPFTLASAIITTAASITLNITGAIAVQRNMNKSAQQLNQAQGLLGLINTLG